MRRLLIVGLLLVAGSRLQAVRVGDSYEAVLAEKGDPRGRAGSEERLVLQYPDQTIRLVGGRVVGVTDAVSSSPASGASGGAARLPFPQTFVGSPEFHTSAGVQAAGTAFLAKRPGSSVVYLLTVRHLLGPAGGFEREVPAEEVPKFVRRVRLELLWGGSRLYSVQGVAVARTSSSGAEPPDLAIFRAGSAAATDAAELADAVPAAGSPVWVVAHVRGGVAPGTVLHRATVIGLRGRNLECEFENARIVSNGASGAPVVDEQGRVVGVYWGRTTRGGKVFALAVPIPVVLSHLPPDE